MAKKKDGRLTEAMEKMRKTEVSVFPKITARARVKSYERTNDGFKPKLDKGIIFRLTPENQRILDKLVSNQEMVSITIEPIQGQLPLE